MAAIIPIPDITGSFDIIPVVLVYEIITYYINTANEYTAINTLNKLFHSLAIKLQKKHLDFIRQMYYENWSNKYPNKQIIDSRAVDMDFYPVSTMVHINRCSVCYKTFKRSLCQIVAKNGLMDSRASLYVVCDNFKCRMHVAVRFAKYCESCNIIPLKKSLFKKEAYCIRSSGDEQKCFFVTDWLYYNPNYSKLVVNDEFVDGFTNELGVTVYWFEGATRYTKTIPIANVPQKSFKIGEYERVKNGEIAIWKV